MTHKVTYIVSAYDRPRHLRGCLASIQVQTDPDWQVLVADNAVDPDMASRNQGVVRDMYDDRFRYICTDQHLANPAWDCYWASEWIVEHHAEGEWLCFPSDDTYYMPVFQETLIQRAELNNWSLVFPEMLYDRRLHGKYHIIDARPSIGGIDKVGFMVKRSVFPGWPGKNTTLAASCCDGALIEKLVKEGVAWGKIEEVLAIHN